MTLAEVVERALPSNLEAERSVLGAILVHDGALPLVAAIVSASDFFRDAHRRVFECMLQLSAEGVAVDFVTIREALTSAGELDEVGGPAYITALADGVPRSTNVEHYARIIKEKARLRELIVGANKTAAAAYEAGASSAALIEDAVQRLLASTVTVGGAVKAVDAVLRYVASLDDVTQGGAMPTGYIDLDQMLGGGVHAKDLIVLAGRPSAGKSSLGLAMALGLARAGFPSVFFSLEMATQALAARLLSWGARVDKSRIAGGFIGDREHFKMSNAMVALTDVPLWLQDSAATLVEVGAWCQRLKVEQGIKCAVIDYMQLLAPGQVNRESAVAAASHGLKQLAKTQDMAIVALSAMNRAPEGRKDNRPRLSDLRESGAIESDADVALLLFRQEQYDPGEDVHGIAEVIVAKNRDGPTGVTRLAFIAEFGGMFENLAIGG